MTLEMGKRITCEDGAQYMVTKAGSGELSSADVPAGGEPAKLGKRYTCSECGATVLCVKAGTGIVCCDGQPMELMAGKALPSSD